MTGRRSFLQSLAALPVVAGCAGAPVESRRHYTPSGTPLRRVLVSPDRVIRTVTGLRPFRVSGFVVRAETFEGTTVVHNYGHGGAGITLSWGTAHLALELAETEDKSPCAVLGCGAVGLATARLLQRRGVDVTIYARDLPPNTTSDVAGAQWSPASLFEPDAVDDAFYGTLEKALALAYREFQRLAGERHGIRWVSNYLLSDGPPDDEDLRLRYPEMFPELRMLDASEHPFPASRAMHFDTMFIEPPVYLPALMRDFRNAGGRIVVREFEDVAGIIGLDESLVFNCTGLGARDLFGDEELMPVKGQLVVLKPQPEVDYLVIRRGAYMFPRSDGVLLGGTFDRDEWSLAPDDDVTRRLLERHAAFFRNMEDPWSHRWS